MAAYTIVRYGDEWGVKDSSGKIAYQDVSKSKATRWAENNIKPAADAAQSAPASTAGTTGGNTLPAGYKLHTNRIGKTNTYNYRVSGPNGFNSAGHPTKEAAIQAAIAHAGGSTTPDTPAPTLEDAQTLTSGVSGVTAEIQADPIGSLNTYTQEVSSLSNQLTALSNEYGQDPPEEIKQYIIELEKKLFTANQNLNTAKVAAQQQQAISGANLITSAATDPSSIVSKATQGTIDTTGTEIAAGTGQVTGSVAAPLTPASVVEAAAAEPVTAATYDAAGVTGATEEAMAGVEAVQGEVPAEGMVTAEEGTSLAQLELEAAQLAQAQTIQAPAERVLEEGELIQGSSVDMEKVNQAVQFEAAQAIPSEKATVQGQLADLTENFDAKNPPAWAAGALRAASAQMAARGLGASSMAGQAIVQATLEAALPIAMADAQTRAQFEAQNLSNRQQAALFAAEQRAQFLGMEFTQEFQTRVANSARIGEIANINFTAEQQIALENARMAQSVDLANLQYANAKIMADAAALTQLDLTNLNNRQQAAVANAKAFLDINLANLSNEQQTTLFKAQALQQALLSDQAAENAALQFNAASENQTNQFMTNLNTQISQFNAAQRNAMEQFNAGQANALAQFNASMENQREQFNAANSLIVAQANAQWRQSVSTTEYAAQHEANMAAAQASNNLTTVALDQLYQRERDLMAFAFTSSESAMDRNLSVILADKELEAVRMELDAQEKAARTSALGSLASTFLFGTGGSGGFGGILGGIL